jgi:predicted transcriptional regulator
MTPILKTVNLATLNYAQAILKEADIPFFTMDENVSIIEGSIGIIPRRLIVLDDYFADAVDLF